MHRAITFDTAWLMSVSLLALRLSAVFLMTPLLAAASVPPIARVLLILSLSAVLSMSIPFAALPAGSPTAALDGAGALFRAGLTELALGATLALGIQLAFAAFSMAGQLLGLQIGFGMGQVLDPTSNASVPILTSAYNQVAVVLFFLVNGHHALLRGIAFSLERFPLGQPWHLEAALMPIVRQVSGMFALGFALAAPVAVTILLVDMALGAVARQLPQLNMLTLGIPIKIVVGLLAASLWFDRMGGLMTRAYDGIYRTWDAILQPVSQATPARRPSPALATVLPTNPRAVGIDG
jgi:flagellar biosynthetic protein FliR